MMILCAQTSSGGSARGVNSSMGCCADAGFFRSIVMSFMDVLLARPLPPEHIPCSMRLAKTREFSVLFDLPLQREFRSQKTSASANRNRTQDLSVDYRERKWAF